MATEITLSSIAEKAIVHKVEMGSSRKCVSKGVGWMP